MDSATWMTYERSAEPSSLGGVPTDVDREGAPDRRFEVGGEVEPAGLEVLVHQCVEARFVDGHLTAQEHVDLALILVDAGDIDAEVGETRSGHQSHVARTYHANMHPLPPAALRRDSSRATGDEDSCNLSESSG